MKDSHGVERENPPQPVEEHRHRRRSRQPGERLGLGAGTGPVGGATGGERHEAADDGSDREKDRSASRFSPCSIVNVCTGGVKYQLTSRNPTTAAVSAGQTPPTAEITTTSSRNNSRTLGSPRSVRRFVSTQVRSGRPIAPRRNPSSTRRRGRAPGRRVRDVVARAPSSARLIT